MTEKGCDNCYYSFFDERAYPCSLCIRGIERTDQWQPSKKTKADRKIEPTGYNLLPVEDEPQTETHDLRTNTHECVSDTPQTERRTDRDGDVWEWRGDAWYCIGQADTPQTDVYDYKGHGNWERSE